MKNAVKLSFGSAITPRPSELLLCVVSRQRDGRAAPRCADAANSKEEEEQELQHIARGRKQEEKEKEPARKRKCMWNWASCPERQAQLPLEMHSPVTLI